MERAKDIFEDLRTIEVNTVVKNDMSAEKMPSLPFALLDIIHDYGCKLQVELEIELGPFLEPPPEVCWDALVAGAQGESEAARDYDACVRGACKTYLELDALFERDTPLAKTLRLRAKPDAPGAGPGPYAKSIAAIELGDRDKRDLFDHLPDLWAVFEQPSIKNWVARAPYGKPGASFSMEHVHNGWDTFERLRQALIHARGRGDVERSEVGLTRISINCSQLKYIIQGVQRRPPVELERRRGLLSALGFGSDDAADSGTVARRESLIPKTRNQLLDGTLRYERIPTLLTPEQMNIVRKAWEFGVEEVVAQTYVQLDGDVLSRVSERLLEGDLAEHHDQLLAVHKASIDVGMSHWSTMLEAASEFVARAFGSVKRLVARK